ncbi:type VI secretion system baseplate subunit TssG [Photobacterium sanctipauli]|uniref:type VI secretion system baseplate subunit TssG n=1 Tax=Photobacterium sanctipauli TaxID=1342794 RepID=UPI00056BDF65|nr:type VI secretion system baseplate subunit TssG [Photobacterium sanctipauli]
MSVASHLYAQPEQFEFIQAVRILNQLAQQDGVNPNPSSIKMASDPMPKGMPSEVTGLEKANDQIKLRLGLEALSGCKGVIPDYLYAEMLNSLHQDDQALEQFLGVFNSLYYELLASVEQAGSLLLRDEKDVASSSNAARLTQRSALASMFALPPHHHDASFLRYGLALANKSRSLSGLKRLLCDYFSLDISPQVLPSALYRIRSAHQTKIGWDKGQNHQLGKGVVLGAKGEQAFKSLEIFITPRNKDEYLNLLKNTHMANAMKQLVRAYLRESSDPKLYLYVKREYIDSPVLSSGNSSVRLGEANCLAPERKSSRYRKILLLPENNV